MKMREAIISVMKSQKVTQTDLAKMFGKTTQSFIGGRLNVESMSVNSSLEMLDKLGYDIVIRPREGVTGSEYTITKD